MRGLGSVWEFEGSSPTPILPGQHKGEGQTKIFLYPRTYITVSPPRYPPLSLRVLVHFLLSRWYHTQTGLPLAVSPLSAGNILRTRRPRVKGLK